MAGCGGNDTPRTPTSPTPSPTLATTNAYILPDAVSKGDWAFGDEPIVVYKGARLRWVNADTLTHVIVADSPDATDFRKTDELPRTGGEQSFIRPRLVSSAIARRGPSPSRRAGARGLVFPFRHPISISQ